MFLRHPSSCLLQILLTLKRIHNITALKIFLSSHVSQDSSDFFSSLEIQLLQLCKGLSHQFKSHFWSTERNGSQKRSFIKKKEKYCKNLFYCVSIYTTKFILLKGFVWKQCFPAFRKKQCYYSITARASECEKVQISRGFHFSALPLSFIKSRLSLLKMLCFHLKELEILTDLACMSQNIGMLTK